MSYIVLSALLVYIIITSLFGLQQVGIWYFWVRVSDRVTRRRCVTVYVDVSILSWSNKATSHLTAQLVDDVYCPCHQCLCVSSHSSVFYLWWSKLCRRWPRTSKSMVKCRRDATHVSRFRMERRRRNHAHSSSPPVRAPGWIDFLHSVLLDDCQMTVMGRILLRFFYKVWFFGAVYFCLSWLFLIVRRSACADLWLDGCFSPSSFRSFSSVVYWKSSVNANRTFKNSASIVYSKTVWKMRMNRWFNERRSATNLSSCLICFLLMLFMKLVWWMFPFVIRWLNQRRRRNNNSVTGHSARISLWIDRWAADDVDSLRDSSNFRFRMCWIRFTLSSIFWNINWISSSPRGDLSRSISRNSPNGLRRSPSSVMCFRILSRKEPTNCFCSLLEALTQSCNHLIELTLLIIDRTEEEQFTIQFSNRFSDTTKILADVVVFVNVLLEILKDEKKEWKVIRLQTSEIHDFLRRFTTVGRCRLIVQ